MRTALATALFLLTAASASAQTLLLQQPTVNRTQVVFAYADDLWSVPRTGGSATRLTSGPGLETAPIFSPDGKHIAFTADYDGNLDVYVMPAAGGQPKRLTWHPGPDRAVGWTPDSKRVLFTSMRDNETRSFGGRLFTVAIDGGHPEPVPLPHADHGGYSPDGTQLAYVPHKLPSRMAWKRYRGGTASFIWLAQLSDSSVKLIPRQDSNDHSPVWIGDKVYFLSDRDGPTTLFEFDTKTNSVRKLLDNKGEDVKSLQGGPDCLVYEQFGSIHLFDLQTKSTKKLDIRIDADFPGLHQRTVKAAKSIANASISPTGVRAVFEARGDIFTAPLKKGDIRNLTHTDSVAERDPAWSPDGKSIAYFSDASGEYELHVRDQNGMGEPRKFALGKAPSYYYHPTWSPDSTKIAYIDVRGNTWFLDLATGDNQLIDTQTYYARNSDFAWSPDSKWLAYAKNLKNHLHAVFIYSLADKKSHQATDGMSDARFPAFDRSGKYLYFAASTDIGPAVGGIEMSNFNYPVSRNVYVMVLDKTLPSPLAPESDEEKADAAQKIKKDDKGEAKKVAVKIDFKDLDQRILALPLPARNYGGLQAGKDGVLFVVEGPPAFIVTRDFVPKFTLSRFDLTKRKAEPFVEGINNFDVSANGEKLLYRQKDAWHIVDTATSPKPGDGLLKLDDIEVRVDPRAEWKQMYREVWRIERDFLYDPGYHGVDLKAMNKRFALYLDHVASRRDLNYLFQEMLGEFSLGHVYVTGGDASEIKSTKTGLLGADFAIDNGKYRIAKIYKGENWNPDLRAPLTGPGIDAPVGSYLLAVNGVPVDTKNSVHRYFEATAGKATLLRISTKADGSDAREVTVVPIADELPLRNRSWIEANRQKVAEMTKGKAAYVYLPDTAVGGYTNFNRYFFAQVDKDAVIIDERFNGGGKAADWVVDRLARPLVNLWSTRYGADYTTPAGQIFGPKVMLANEHSGSGGDYLPWAFQRYKLGPVVGKRTWGGLVGIGGYPQLLDGGGVTAPHFAFWTPEGKWEVENRGVPPDVEIEFDPKLWRKGRDPQLEKAVEIVLAELAKSPPKKYQRPAYPNYQTPSLAPQSSNDQKRDLLLGQYGRLRANSDLLYYHLDVRVDPAKKTISGKNTIRFKMLKDDNRIQIDLHSALAVDKIMMGDTKLKYEREAGSVFIDFPETLKAGRIVSIDFHYSGTPAQKGRFGGFTFGKDPKGRPWIYTSCEMQGASVWWPNKDQWRDKVDSMDISVAIPNGLVDVSNGRFVGKKDLGDGYTRWDWHVSYPINNYNVSLNIGAYEHFSDKLGDLDMDFYALPEDLERAKMQFAQAKGMLQAFQHYFGDYPFKRDGYKLIQVPYSGMEHQSAVTYGNLFKNGYLGRDWTGVGISPKFDFIIIHESGHEWFGNAVSAADRSDMWIHEGWTTYLESLYVEFHWGKADAIKYINGYQKMVKNARPIIATRGINAYPPEDQYFKGTLFLNTLRSVIDDDVRWFKLLRGMYDQFKYQTIMTEDVVAYFNRETGKDLTPIFDQYLRHAALPVLELKFDEPKGEVAYRWKAEEKAFAMPIRVGEPGRWQLITPTSEWQTMRTPLGKANFQVATDLYYVAVARQ